MGGDSETNLIGQANLPSFPKTRHREGRQAPPWLFGITAWAASDHASQTQAHSSWVRGEHRRQNKPIAGLISYRHNFPARPHVPLLGEAVPKFSSRRRNFLAPGVDIRHLLFAL